MINDAYEIKGWVDVHRPMHLTVGDLRRMKKGKVYDCVNFHRNFPDYIWDTHEELTVFRASYLFANYRAKIKYLGDAKWSYTHAYGETFEYNVHIDVSPFQDAITWAPLEDDGYLRMIPHKGSKLPKIVKHWTKFSDNTRIGWRGPMMWWKDLKERPPVYYHDILKLKVGVEKKHECIVHQSTPYEWRGGKKYELHEGPRGGIYIVKGKRRIYIKRSNCKSLKG